jgi:putative acetyltransferase
MILRSAEARDHAEIARIVRAAFMAEFGRSEEPELIEHVRALGDSVRETVAEDAGEIVGHILFSRAFIEADGVRHPAVQLAPVCAAPGRQNAGIGAALIRDGLAALEVAGETHVFLLGHPGYYPRFGFSAEAARAFDAPWNGPHHMLRRLAPRGPDGGRITVSKAFG